MVPSHDLPERLFVAHERRFKLFYGSVPGETLDVFMSLPGYLDSQLVVAHEAHDVRRKRVGVRMRPA